MATQQDTSQLIKLTLTEFADALGSDQTAPGGGSASALAGALGGALAVMVARLTLGVPNTRHTRTRWRWWRSGPTC